MHSLIHAATARVTYESPAALDRTTAIERAAEVRRSLVHGVFSDAEEGETEDLSRRRGQAGHGFAPRATPRRRASDWPSEAERQAQGPISVWA